MPISPLFTPKMTPFPLGLTLDQGRYRITAPLYGQPDRGVYFGQTLLKSTATPVLITLAFQQSVAYAELTRDLTLAVPRIAPLLFIGELHQSAIDAPMDAMVEALPWGVPSQHLLSPPVDPAMVVGLGSAIASLIQAAHAQGDVVLGLRPEAIYLQPTANGYELTGVVSRSERFLMTAQRPCSGTLPCFEDCYLAPEVLLGYPPTPAADVFSLCAVLLYWLTGHHPFGDDGYQAQALAMMTGDRPTLTDTDPLYRWLDRGLIHDADTRLTLNELMAGLATV